MKKFLGSAALMVALLGSVNTWATDVGAGRGVLTFTGSVSSKTCTVSGLDNVIDFGDVTVGQIKSVTGWTDIVSPKIHTITFSDCGTISKIKLTPSLSNVKSAWHINPTGLGQGVYFASYWDELASGDHLIKEGVVIVRNVADGKNVLPVYVRMFPGDDGKSPVEGPIEAEIAFSIDYE